jgi:hypothetical protein
MINRYSLKECKVTGLSLQALQGRYRCVDAGNDMIDTVATGSSIYTL